MKKDTATPPADPAPAFAAASAQPVPPRRHAPTARTVGFVQPDADGRSLLFSATRDFIATASADEAKPFLAPPPAS